MRESFLAAFDCLPGSDSSSEFLFGLAGIFGCHFEGKHSSLAFTFLGLSDPTLRRTSALVTEWSQNWGHSAKLSC
jgi:hypothetical protein